MSEDKVITEIVKAGEGLTATDIARYCQEEGVTIPAVCKALAEGLESCYPGKMDNNGEWKGGSTEADMPTRHKYMTSALEVLRMVKKETVMPVATAVNINIGGEALGELLHMVKDVAGQLRALGTSGQQTGEIIDVNTDTAHST